MPLDPVFEAKSDVESSITYVPYRAAAASRRGGDVLRAAAMAAGRWIAKTGSGAERYLI